MNHLTHATLTFAMLFAVACGPGPKGDQGPQGVPGIDGSNGSDGSTGAPGLDGKDGTNGIDGQNGSDAPTSPYQIVALIDPCGDEGSYEEVLLLLANGTLLAHYSDGNKQFLVQLVPGSYRSTDGHACNFTVNADGSVTW